MSKSSLVSKSWPRSRSAPATLCRRSIAKVELAESDENPSATLSSSCPGFAATRSLVCCWIDRHSCLGLRALPAGGSIAQREVVELSGGLGVGNSESFAMRRGALFDAMMSMKRPTWSSFLSRSLSFPSLGREGSVNILTWCWRAAEGSSYYSDDSKTRRRLGLETRGEVMHCAFARWQLEQGEPRSQRT